MGIVPLSRVKGCLPFCPLAVQMLGPALFLLLLAQPTRSADVYCYTGGGNSSTQGTTLGLQNVCLGSDSCFLTINADNSWQSGCVAPAAYASISNPAASFCMASSQPVFCRCNNNFCNTPNNPSFYASLNSTLQNIAKPADSGNLTCFECGSPYVKLANGSRTFAPFNVSCDGSKFCTGKYCVTRSSINPRSYCATSWEDPKTLACQKMTTDPYDDQECICQQNFCNYPYDPMSAPNTTMAPPATTPPPATTIATTPVPTTPAPAPSPWQCASNCSAGQLAFTADTTGQTGLTYGLVKDASGCVRMMVNCTAPAPIASVAFGSQGSLMAFQPNYTAVQALLYCIGGNGSVMWTRFGTSQDPNAMFTVNEAHCVAPPVGSSPPPPVTTSMPTTAATTVATTTMAPPATTAVPIGPWQCVTGCNANLLTLTPDSTPGRTTITANASESPPGCAKMMVNCASSAPAVSVLFGTQGSLAAFQPNFTSVSSLLYCIRNNGALVWTRFGTTSDPNAMLIVTEAHCSVTAPPTTPVPTTLPPTTPVPTTLPPTTPVPTTLPPTTPVPTTLPPTTPVPTTLPPTTPVPTTLPPTTPVPTTLPPTTPVPTTLPPTTPVPTTLPPTTTVPTTLPPTTPVPTTLPPTTPVPTTLPPTTTVPTTLPPTTPVPTTPIPTTLPPTTRAPTTVFITQPPTTTAIASTTASSINNALPPGPWQCVTGCNASQISLMSGSAGTPTYQSMAPNGGSMVTPTFESPPGCTKVLLNCASPVPTVSVMFGTKGSLAAFQPNYTSVQALLYCIRNNGSLVWTRFGTTSDPNALLTVTQASCNTTGTLPVATSPPPSPPPPPPTTPPPTTVSTTLPPTTVSTTLPPTTVSTTLPPTTASTTLPPTIVSTTLPSTTTAKPGNGTTVTCPDGRKFGPNELAVQMGQMLKQSILSGLGSNAGLTAVQDFQDGVNTHICNYMSGQGSGRK